MIVLMNEELTNIYGGSNICINSVYSLVMRVCRLVSRYSKWLIR